MEVEFESWHDILSPDHKQGRWINLQSRVQWRHFSTVFKRLPCSGRHFPWVNHPLSFLPTSSVHAITAQISPVPNSSGIEVLETDTFRLQCFQTHTGTIHAHIIIKNCRSKISLDHRTTTTACRYCFEKSLWILCGLCYEESILSIRDANSVWGVW